LRDQLYEAGSSCDYRCHQHQYHCIGSTCGPGQGAEPLVAARGYAFIHGVNHRGAGSNQGRQHDQQKECVEHGNIQTGQQEVHGNGGRDNLRIKRQAGENKQSARQHGERATQ